MYDKCPACDSTDIRPFNGAKTCGDCGTIFGDFPTFADTTKYVKDEWYQGFCDPNNMRYFDFTYNNGTHRVHGWFDMETKKIVQSG